MKTKQNIYIFLLILLPGVLSCTSTKVKPRPEIKKVTLPIQNNGTRVFSKHDCVHAQNFKTHMKHINRISIQYAYTQKDTDDTKKNQESIPLWQAGIEKELLRTGFIVLQEKSKTEIIDGISLDLDDKSKNNQDSHIAFLILETLRIQKIQNTYVFSLDTDTQAKNTYVYTYYIAEISGKVVVHTNDIVWRSSVITTTFDFIKKREKQEPAVFITALRDYSFSHKQDTWVPGRWLVDKSTDNFQRYFAHANETFHKRELIEFAVKTFIHSLQSDTKGK